MCVYEYSFFWHSIEFVTDLRNDYWYFPRFYFRVFVKVILRGVNPVPLKFFSPKLTDVSSDKKKTFQLLSESNLLVSIVIIQN